MRTVPSVETTRFGIGGAWRKISVPIQPKIEKEKTNIAINSIQSLFMFFVYQTGICVAKVSQGGH